MTASEVQLETTRTTMLAVVDAGTPVRRVLAHALLLKPGRWRIERPGGPVRYRRRRRAARRCLYKLAVQGRTVPPGTPPPSPPPPQPSPPTGPGRATAEVR